MIWSCQLLELYFIKDPATETNTLYSGHTYAINHTLSKQEIAVLNLDYMERLAQSAITVQSYEYKHRKLYSSIGGLDLSLSRILLILLVLAMLLVVARLHYRVNWHPVASFPGPKAAAATNLYGAYDDLNRDGSLCKKVAQLHDKYGMSPISSRL